MFKNFLAPTREAEKNRTILSWTPSIAKLFIFTIFHFIVKDALIYDVLNIYFWTFNVLMYDLTKCTHI